MQYETTGKDFFYETSAVTALTYYIICDGVQIYNGTAVKSPDKPAVRINICRRVSDYLKSNMVDIRDYWDEWPWHRYESFKGKVQHPQQIRTFELYDGEGTLLETYRVMLDYTGEWDGTDETLNDPIDFKTDSREKIFITTVKVSTGTTRFIIDKA